MQKPDFPIESEEWLDYGIAERVARHLQSSPLHVFSAYVLMSMPAALGDPNDSNSGLFMELTLLTDDQRGWLVLVAADREWDVEKELAEFVEEMRKEVSPSAPPCIVRAVEPGEVPAPGVLDLRNPADLRSRLEHEFEHHFAGRPPTNVEAFLEPFESYRYAVRNEAEIRAEMNQTTGGERSA
ncbi:MAG: hypothetical protein AAGF12_05825 [Myxococcota bacterium]